MILNKSPIVFLVLVLLVAGTGSYLGGKFNAVHPPLLELHASTVTKKGNLLIGTGSVNEKSTGFYSFDQGTGKLYCRTIDRYSGELTGEFDADVFKDMLFDKVGGQNYLMLISGNSPGAGQTAATRLGQSTCYIVEPETGKTIGYKAEYKKRDQLRGGFVSGKLKAVSKFVLRDRKTRVK